MLLPAFRLFSRLVSLLVPAVLAVASPGQSRAGEWSGTVDLPGQKLAVHVHLTETAGAFAGTIDIPAQDAKGLPLTGFEANGDALRFSIADVPGEPTFAGRFSGDGRRFAGEFSQGGATLAFALLRADAAQGVANAAFDGFQAWLDESLPLLHVPGCAVAVVKDGALLATFQSGVRDVEAGLPVTADTLFAIGSTSKAFTTWLLATLVAEGRLAWDEPVRTWMPDFALADEAVAGRLTPRDLVTHRSGMPRHDLVWYGAALTRAEMVARLRWLPLSRDLRTEFQYNNLMYLTAGHLAERIAGRTWEELVRERILQPLGMARTNFAVAESRRDGDHAAPYRRNEKQVRRIAFRDISAVGPAGSINSSVREMAQWIALHLQNGEHGGARLLPAAAVRDLHLPRIPMGDTARTTAEIVDVGYALGWMVDVYRGHRRVHHGGNIDGFSAMVTLLPDHGYGFVALANLDGTPFPELAIRNLCDRALALPPRDWRTEVLQRFARGEQVAEKGRQDAAAERRPGTEPSRALAEFAGSYAHRGYGPLAVEHRDGALHVDFHGLRAPLEHWHYDVFRCLKTAENPEIEGTLLQFTSDLAGEVDGVSVVLDPNTPPIAFAREPDAELKDPTFLRRLAGQYELDTQIATFTVEGSALVVTLPGQRHKLEPTTRLRFRLDGLSGYSARFLLDGEGNPAAVRFVQPDGVFEGKRKRG